MTIVGSMPWLAGPFGALIVDEGEGRKLLVEQGYAAQLPDAAQVTTAQDPGSTFTTSATHGASSTVYPARSRTEAGVSNNGTNPDGVVWVTAGGAPKPIYPDGPPFITRSHDPVIVWSPLASVRLGVWEV